MHIDAELAPTCQHINRLIVIFADDHAVSRGRLRQFVDFIPQGDDIFSRLTQGETQFFILGRFLSQLALHLHQTFFKLADSARNIRLHPSQAQS